MTAVVVTSMVSLTALPVMTQLAATVVGRPVLARARPLHPAVPGLGIQELVTGWCFNIAVFDLELAFVNMAMHVLQVNGSPVLDDGLGGVVLQAKPGQSDGEYPLVDHASQHNKCNTTLIMVGIVGYFIANVRKRGGYKIVDVCKVCGNALLRALPQGEEASGSGKEVGSARALRALMGVQAALMKTRIDR